jgi:preprotein translocase subunit SecG
MKFMTLAAIPLYAQILAVLFVLTCIILIIIVLLQKGRGGGLSAAFGGAGGHSAFGSKTGDVFTKITIGIVAFFLILSMVLTKVWVPYEPLDEQQGLLNRGQPGAGQPPSTAGQTPDSSKENEGSSTPSESKPGTNPAGGESPPANPGSETSGNSTNPTQSNKPKEGN